MWWYIEFLLFLTNFELFDLIILKQNMQLQ